VKRPSPASGGHFKRRKAPVKDPAPQGPAFPLAWGWFVDEAVPTWVKSTYSPRESWKDKPFSKDDLHFFSKGVLELSDLFTEERSRKIPDYFAHPKYRSSYLLYFLPLQAAKFITLFHLHSGAMQAMLAEARKSGTLRVSDLGAGPGTASIALLLWLLEPAIEVNFKIELHWADLNQAIMEDGRALALKLASHFPKLRDRVSIETKTTPWWKLPSELPGPTQLSILGNVLNESPGGPLDFTKEKWGDLWHGVVARAEGGGLLMLEPAIRRAAQSLSKVRDNLLETELLARTGRSFWGPCLHAGSCPLGDGRDWCHFSVPARIPGQWFREFSETLGSERQWLKFSFLWLASPGNPAPEPQAALRRVVSDPLGGDERGPQEVLICEPDAPAKIKISSNQRVHRGDIIRP
jgi:hypothetical protein